MPCWPISQRDGIFQVTDGDGILHPITLNRLPVETFNPGWRAIGLQTGLPPFHLLELRHDAAPEQDAVWYLNDELDFVANSPRHFSVRHGGEMVSGLSPLLRDIHDQTLCAPQPAVAASSHAFDGINPAFVAEMIGFVVNTAMSAPDVVLAHRLEGISAHYTADGTQLSTALLRRSLDVALPQSAGDEPRLASPFDSAWLAVQEHFETGVGPVRHVYRFRDPVGQMTLYLLFQQDGAPALYIPMMNTVFAARDGIAGTEVMTALFSHYASHSERVVPRHAGEVVQPHAGEVVQPHAGDATSPAEAPVMPDADLPPVVAAVLREPAGPERVPPHDERHRTQPGDTPPAPFTVDLHPRWWKRLFGLGNP